MRIPGKSRSQAKRDNGNQEDKDSSLMDTDEEFD